MPTFRDSEKQRYRALKPRLFSEAACRPGTYAGRPRDFCLADAHAAENLHESLRDESLRYFRERRIQWHKQSAPGLPSNHLCSSQVACVNALWPLARDPELLARVFGPLLPELDEPLPFDADRPLPDGTAPFLAFEWIGTRGYLGERGGRSRGANATSADFAFRFRRRDDRVQLVLGEWKYTESYARRLPPPTQLNPAQLATYRGPFARWRERQPGLPAYEAFFVEPFYQLMRLTLLALEMERAAAEGAGELGAEVVSVVEVVPRANREFATAITSPELARYGCCVAGIWDALAPAGRFTPVAAEGLLMLIEEAAPADKAAWAADLLLRYGWWRLDSPSISADR
jgi:hypothetical protein